MTIGCALSGVCSVGLLLGQMSTAQLAPGGETQAQAGAPTPGAVECQRADGYGVPYSARGASGVDMRPVHAAVYADAARKTFFAYLAATPDDPVRVGFFDHASGTVPKPVILPIGPEFGAVDSVGVAIDDQGFIWVGLSAAKGGPAAVYKSDKPYDIAAFARLAGPAMANAKLWQVPNQGFLMIGQRTESNGVAPWFANSVDGLKWSEPVKLATIDTGHTFIAARQLTKVGVAIATWTAGQTAADATNIYYLETSDAGRTWQDVRHVNLTLPVTGKEQGLLAWDYRSIQWTVQFKDMGFAAAGRPVVLYLNSREIQPGMPPACTWTTARFVPRGWESTGILPGSCPADQGALFLEPGNAWRLFTVRNGKPVPGQEDFIAWFTMDQGRSWFKRAMISDRPSELHTLVHVADAQPDFYALWLRDSNGGPSSRPAQATAPAAPTSRPSRPGEVLLLNREADALLLPSNMADTTVKPATGPVTTRPATQPG